MSARTGVTAFALGMLVIGPVAAQSNAPAAPGVIPEKQAPSLDSGRSESLSKKLSKSGGVISPGGDIDPGMKVPAPDPHPNTTPVIPPSATGGNSAK